VTGPFDPSAHDSVCTCIVTALQPNAESAFP
jgi:hypothetical protein